MKKFLLKNLIFLGFFGLILFGFSAQAANVDEALKGLSEATGENITTKAQAGEICDKEKYLTTCAEIGKKYSLYDQAEVKQVEALVGEIKGQIESELKKCQTTECLVEVANKLSQKVSAKNPKLAEQAELSSKFVQKKQAIIDAAKELGIDFEKCRKMDPETASVETLRGCAKLAKDSRVKENIPKEALEQAEMGEKAADFQEALKNGQVQCGNGTMEGCGSFCLKPSTETKAQGTAAIPAVCRQIAEKYFGPEGVKHLEDSYQQVDKVRSSYLKKAESLTFQTVDGQIITNPEEIGKYMEEQGKNGNVEAVEKGMDFMINNGFIKPEEKDYALKFVKQIRGQGGLRDFDACGKDPQSCSDFIPPEAKSEFEAQKQIKEAITQETGFDPSQCGSGDPAVGEKCFQGAKKALEKLQTLENQNPNTQKIINDLRQKVNRQEEFHGQREQLKQVIQQQGGPGGCKSEEECRSFCSDSANGQECFSFGAKQGAAGFQGSEGQERLQQFNQKIQEVQENQRGPFGGQKEGGLNFPGRGPFPGFQPPGQGGTPPGQMEDFQKDGQNFQRNGPDFQRNGQNFQQNQPNQSDQFKQNMPMQNQMMPNQFNQQNQFQKPSGEQPNFQPSPPSGGATQGGQPPLPPSGGSGGIFQQPPPSGGSSGGSQPPPPPPPTGLINNSFFGNAARAFIRLSN